MKYHIALFAPSLRGGGAERVVVRLSNALALRDWKVDVVLAQASGPLLEDLLSQVTVHDLQRPRVASSIWSLKQYLEKSRPQVLVSFLSHANIVSLWARMLSKWRPLLIVTEHNNLTVRYRMGGRRLNSLLLLLSRRFYPSADAVVAVSQGVANDLLRHVRLEAHRLHVIYNPVVHPEVFKKAAEEVGHPWLIDKSCPVILGVGRLTEQKDFATLIRAFALVRQQEEARLIILGEGDQRESLTRLACQLGVDEHVDMPGFVKNPYAYMQRADVFVLSSQWEGFANVLVEALCLGTPVVSTDCPYGPSEILQGGRLGRLCPVGDSKAIAQAILETLCSPPPPVAAEEYRPYTTEYAVERYAQLVEKIVSNARGRLL